MLTAIVYLWYNYWWKQAYVCFGWTYNCTKNRI